MAKVWTCPGGTLGPGVSRVESACGSVFVPVPTVTALWLACYDCRCRCRCRCRRRRDYRSVAGLEASVSFAGPYDAANSEQHPDLRTAPPSAPAWAVGHGHGGKAEGLLNLPVLCRHINHHLHGEQGAQRGTGRPCLARFSPLILSSPLSRRSQSTGCVCGLFVGSSSCPATTSKAPSFCWHFNSRAR